MRSKWLIRLVRDRKVGSEMAMKKLVTQTHLLGPSHFVGKKKILFEVKSMER